MSPDHGDRLGKSALYPTARQIRAGHLNGHLRTPSVCCFSNHWQQGGNLDARAGGHVRVTVLRHDSEREGVNTKPVPPTWARRGAQSQPAMCKHWAAGTPADVAEKDHPETPKAGVPEKCPPKHGTSVLRGAHHHAGQSRKPRAAAPLSPVTPVLWASVSSPEKRGSRRWWVPRRRPALTL